MFTKGLNKWFLWQIVGSKKWPHLSSHKLFWRFDLEAPLFRGWGPCPLYLTWAGLNHASAMAQGVLCAFWGSDFKMPRPSALFSWEPAPMLEGSPHRLWGTHVARPLAPSRPELLADSQPPEGASGKRMLQPLVQPPQLTSSEQSADSGTKYTISLF